MTDQQKIEQLQQDKIRLQAIVNNDKEVFRKFADLIDRKDILIERHQKITEKWIELMNEYNQYIDSIFLEARKKFLFGILFWIYLLWVLQELLK